MSGRTERLGRRYWAGSSAARALGRSTCMHGRLNRTGTGGGGGGAWRQRGHARIRAGPQVLLLRGVRDDALGRPPPPLARRPCPHPTRPITQILRGRLPGAAHPCSGRAVRAALAPAVADLSATMGPHAAHTVGVAGGASGGGGGGGRYYCRCPSVPPPTAAPPMLIWAMHVAAPLLAAWMAARCALAAPPESASPDPCRGEMPLRHRAGCGRALQSQRRRRPWGGQPSHRRDGPARPADMTLKSFAPAAPLVEHVRHPRP